MDASQFTADMHTIEFDGKQWVELAVEWAKLPDALKAASDKWSRRLSKLRIPVSECRFTHKGDITKLYETTNGGRKSVFMFADSWTRYIRKAVCKLNKKNGHQSANQTERDDDNDMHSSAAAPQQCAVMNELSLTLDEQFVHNGTVLKVRAYGVKTPDGMYFNCEDAMNVLAIRDDKIPSLIELTLACVEDREIVVISYDMLITLICIKAKNFPVAAELKKWIMHVTHSVQFNTDQKPMRQAEFASRHATYRAKDYGLIKRPVLYLTEVCSAHEAHKMYPEQIAAALPDGADMNDCSVFKCGFTLNEMERIGDVRGDLKAIFPGCDPRPVHTSEFPCATKDQMETEERIAFWNDFDTQRIRDIRLRERNYTELLVMNHVDVQTAKNNMNMQSHLFIQSKLDSCEQRVTTAESRVRDLEQEKMIFDLRMATLTEKNSALQSEKSVLQNEVETTRRGALTVMPKEAAAIASAFWGMCAN